MGDGTMRFIALLRKELREAVPWMVLAGIVFLFFGSINIQASAVRHYRPYELWNTGTNSNDSIAISSYRFTYRSRPLRDIGPLLFFASIGLGLVLGGRQFWMADFIKMWSFTIHRSINRRCILWSKFAATVITFVVSLGSIWTLFFLYASKSGIFYYPPRGRIYVEGWVLILTGLVMYFGTALAGLDRARWYTTKMAGIGFAVFILFLALVNITLAGCFATILIGLLMLVLQIVNTFSDKQF
jgi:hypothetical protein